MIITLIVLVKMWLSIPEFVITSADSPFVKIGRLNDVSCVFECECDKELKADAEIPKHFYSDIVLMIDFASPEKTDYG